MSGYPPENDDVIYEQPVCPRRKELGTLNSPKIRAIVILTFSELFIMHIPKFCSLVHWFQNCSRFCSTTFPSHVGTFVQQLLVLHCNYKGDVAPKFDLVIILDWGVYRVKVNIPEQLLG